MLCVKRSIHVCNALTKCSLLYDVRAALKSMILIGIFIIHPSGGMGAGLSELGEAHLGLLGQLQQNIIMKKLEMHPFSSPPTSHFLVSQFVHMNRQNILSFAWHSATMTIYETKLDSHI